MSSRTLVAVLLLAPVLAACGTEAATVAAPVVPPGETVLVRAGVALLAVDGRSGRMLHRTPLGVHDAQATVVYRATGDAASSSTLVSATDPVTGRRVREIRLPGTWTIPVAAGSTPEGALSGDGRTLVLAGRSDARRSQFALLGSRLDASPSRLSLPGRYDFDALAPDASAVYLSEIRGDGRYRVRSYDVARGRLRPRVVVEKTTLGVLMQGLPVTRAVDPSGSPVFTLYRGGPAGAFVHALNTAEGTALCILLPDSERAGPAWRLALDTEARELHAVNRDLGAHHLIDPEIGEITAAPAGARLPGLEAQSPDGDLTYAVEGDGSIAVRRGGGRAGRLPSPGAEPTIVAVR